MSEPERALIAKPPCTCTAERECRGCELCRTDERYQKLYGCGPGLGDRVQQALGFLGITSQRIEKITGKKCNCPQRQRWLNEMGRTVERKLRRKRKGES